MTNSEVVTKTDDIPTPGRQVLPAIVIPYFAMWLPGVLVGLLLIEIGDAFGHTPAIAGQLETAANLVAAIGSIIMGILSVRYKHRSL